MAGKIIVSTLQSDTDNSISFVANTGATIFSANLSNGIAGSFIGAGSITGDKIASSATLTTPIISGNLNLDSTGTTGVRVPSANTLTFHTAGTEDMRIDSSGNVGIGTNNPQAKVHVGSSATAPGFGTSSEMVYNIGATQPEFLVRQTGSSVVCSIAADNGGGYVRTATNHQLSFLTNNTEQMRLTTGGLLQFNSGYGSVTTAYGCRAFAKFDGSSNAITRSGNISSITDRGTGLYRANFTNNLVDADYTVVTAGQHNGYAGALLGAGGSNGATDSNTNTYVALECRNFSNTNNEPNELFFAVFR